MKFKFNSLRFKITVLSLLVLTIILLIYSVFLFLTFRITLYQELDENLKAKAQKINNAIVSYLDVLGSDDQSFHFAVSRVISQTGDHPHKNKIEKLENLWIGQITALGVSRDYVEFFDEKGQSLARSGNLNSDLLAPPDKEIQWVMTGHRVYKDLDFKEDHLRVVLLPFGYKKQVNYIVAVGTSRVRVMRILKTRLLSESVLILTILLVSSLLSHFFVRSVLKPVNSIIETVGNIDYKDLSTRISTKGVDIEIKYLVDSLNEMMSRLEKSFKYITEFGSHVSHELKTPLAIIRGESELALRGDRTPEEYRKVIEDNLEEVVRMSRIIEDLLLLTRLDYQPGVFKFEKFDLIEFFRDITDSSRILAGEKNINVYTEFPEKPLYVQASHIHLRRLFFNLINNAIKFTDPDGRISLSLHQEDGEVVVSVSDTGPGISEENIPKIFDQFFHADPAGYGNPPGNGLGLAIAQSIAKIHGGGVRVQSLLGHGSTFTVRLPLAL